MCVVCVCVCMYVCVCPTLCNLMDCSLPGSTVHGILQARILERVAISFFKGPSWPRDQTHVSFSLLNCQAGSLSANATWETPYIYIYMLCLETQSCPTLCDSKDCSPPGASVYGDSLGKTLEWIARSSSRRSSQPRDWTQVSRTAGGFFTIWATREAQEYWSG